MEKTQNPDALTLHRGFLLLRPLRPLRPLSQSVTTPPGSTYLSGLTGRPFTCTS